MSTVFDKFRLDGRCALVVGGAGLLGRGFCRALAEAGAAVVVADHLEDRAHEVAGTLAADGLTACAVGVDITDAASVEQMVDAAESRFGCPAALVNAAAMDPKFDASANASLATSFEAFPLEQWRQALDVNLTGMFLTCQAVARRMAVSGQGAIVNICSTYGLVGPDQRIYEAPGQPTRFKPVYYSVTKAGVLGLTRYLATYYAGTRIRTNALTPGGVYNQHDEAFVQAYSTRTVLGRMAHIDEMDAAVLFLASDASSYMTGANLVVDGGWTAW